MPYWDDGSGQSKKEYDAGGGYDHHGNQNLNNNNNNNNNNPNPHTGPTEAEIAAAKAKKEAEKKALEDAKYKTWLTDTKEKKKKKTDWFQKGIDTVDSGMKLKNFATSLNPLDLMKVNPKMLGIQLLYNTIKKNKKSKNNDKVSSLDVDTPMLVADASAWTTPIEGLGGYNYSDTKTLLDAGYDPEEVSTWKNNEGTELIKTLKLKKGGVARKKYSRGTGYEGILSLEDEDSEDISLTAFNPNFDESPQFTDEEQLQIDSEEKEDGEKRIDLFAETDEGDPLNELLLAEDGVTTLFRAKNGGTPQLAKKSKDGTRPGYRGSDWGDDPQGEFGGIDSGGWDPGVSSPGTTSSGGSAWTGGDDQEDDNAQMMKDMYKTSVTNVSGGDIWDWDETSETDDVIETYNNVKDRYDRNKTKQNLKMLVSVLSGDIFGVVKNAYGMNKDKKAYEDMLNKLQQDALDLGIPAYSPHTDTLPQIIGQELIDINKKPKEKEDDGPDGPEVVPVAPVIQELTEYEQMAWDPMSYLDKIRAKQAQRASLIEKGIIQDNETMTLNSGGLANLFRVKNY